MGVSVPIDCSRAHRRALTVALAVIVLAAAIHYGFKAADSGSAIVRWRGLIEHLIQGGNVYNEPGLGGSFPNPPILALALWPLTLLPPLAAALVWFFAKVVMAGAALYWSMRLATADAFRLSTFALLVLLALAARPLLSDLEHGNVNIVILFLVTAGLWAYADGQDWLAGAAIGLATAFKLTPALFIPYFAYKRQWRVVSGAVAGLVLFLVLVPGLALGFGRSLWLLRSWCGAMILPYVVEGQVETLQTNQSLPGVWLRLTTDRPGLELPGQPVQAMNLVSLDQATAFWILKGLIAAVVVWVAWLARNPVACRRDRRLAAEYALVFIAMLLVSERSWKHHFVTMMLPYSVLVAWLSEGRCGTWLRSYLVGTLAAAFLLMASTSSELGGRLLGGVGHKYAQGYGLFCASAVLVLAALSVMLLSQDTCPSPRLSPDLSQGER